MPDEFCPDCGTPRTALFRYCRGCNLDFDDLDARGVLPGGPFTPSPGAPHPRLFDETEVAADGTGAPGPFERRPSILERRGAAATSAATSHATSTPFDPASDPDTIVLAPPTVVQRPRAPRTARQVRNQRYAAIALTAIVVVGGVAALGMNASWDLHLAPDPGSAGAPGAVAGATGSSVATPAPSDGGGTVAPSPGTTGPKIPTGPTVQGVVERVIDGDTIQVIVGHEEWLVRYIGMDTPESVRPDSPIQYMGPEAAQANQRLVGGQTVLLEQEVSDFDQYGRRLRDVWVHIDGGSLVLAGYDLVHQGYARIDTVPPDVKYQAAMLAAQQDARSADRGLWGNASAAPPSPGATVSPIDLPALISVEPVVVRAGLETLFRGFPGEYTWRTVSFDQQAASVRIDVTSGSVNGCQLDWRIVAVEGTPTTGTIAVDGEASQTSETSIATPTSPDTVEVTTTCSSWKLSVTGRSAL
jgi:endonuclease YncB( thermonuclease family)